MKRVILCLLLIATYLSLSSQDRYIYDENGEKHCLIENTNTIYIKFENVIQNNTRKNINKLSVLASEIDTISKDLYKIRIGTRNISLLHDEIEIMDSVLYSSEFIYPSDSTIQCCFNKVLLKLKDSYDIETILYNSKVDYISCELFGFSSAEYLLTLRDSEAINVANVLYETGKFVYAVPSFYRFNVFDNPMYPQQWGLKNTGQNGGVVGMDINVEPAWNYSTGEGIKVAVIDDGVQLNHPDLQDNLLPGFDATGNNMNGSHIGDDYHGTCCAGIIAACNNNIGIKGVAYNAKIIPIRIGLSGLYVEDEDVISAFNYALSAGADIISCSWHIGVPSAAVANIVNTASQNGRNGLGCPIFFASGNKNESFVDFPASLSNTIAVGSINPNGERVNNNESSGSNYGLGLDIVAPGVQISTTNINSGFKNDFGGTSAACPHAAGVMALILSANPCLTLEEAKTILYMSCDKLPTYSYTKKQGLWNNEVGYGKINAYEAVKLAISSDIPNNVISQNYNIVETLMNLNICGGFPNIATGVYFVDKYEIAQNITFPYTENPTIIGYTNGYSNDNPNDGTNFFSVSNLTNTSAILKTWCYHIRYNVSGQTINKYYPTIPSEIYFDIKVVESSTNRTISNHQLTSGNYDYVAFETISTSNLGVTETANVNIHAGNEVLLLDETFISPSAGGSFYAYIESFNPCSLNQSKRGSNNYHNDSYQDDLSIEEENHYENLSKEETISIFPNPSRGSFNILLSDTNDEFRKVIVYDMMGKIAYLDETFKGGEINLPDVSSGLYYLTIILNKQIIKEKIIIK